MKKAILWAANLLMIALLLATLFTVAATFEAILFWATMISGIAWFSFILLAKPNSKGRSEPKWVDYARSFFPILLIVFTLRSFVIEPFRIPSGSMLPTLTIGDFILVNKAAYGIRLPLVHKTLLETGEVKRGDVVVFRFPKEPQIDYIKRVIGLPGDRITYANKKLAINGQEISTLKLGVYEGKGQGREMTGAGLFESEMLGHHHHILIDQDMPRRFAHEWIVPAGEYFVMGDNRDNSNDSRFWGFVPDDHLKGKAFRVWMHWDSGIDMSRLGREIR
jgi:signal peptidase I